MPFVPHAKCPSRQVSQVPLVAAAICRKRDLASARVANADWASATTIPPFMALQARNVACCLFEVKSSTKNHNEKDNKRWLWKSFYLKKKSVDGNLF